MRAVDTDLIGSQRRESFGSLASAMSAMRIGEWFRALLAIAICLAASIAAAAGDAGLPHDQFLVDSERDTGFGEGVAGLGDVNGDGFADFAVCATRAKQPGGGEGEIRVYFGGPSGVSPQPTQVLHSPGNPSRFGARVAGGDLDGDGFGDAVVAALPFTSTNSFEVALWIFRGSPTGLQTPQAPGFQAPTTSGLAGFGVIGDVNGDGFSDLAIGLPYVRDDAGEVLIFHGGPVLQWSEPDEQLRPHQPRTSFGFFGRGASDFNRDGFADLLVGSPHFSVRGSQNGRAQLFLGSPTGLQTNAMWMAIYPFKPRANVDGDFQYFGNFFAVDDFNRDGLIDAVITAPFATQNDQGEGMAFGYYGIRRAPGLPARFDWSIQANRGGTTLGLTVERIGDVNGDGYPDLLLGAPDYGNQHVREGLAVVFFGSRRGFAKDPDWALESQENHTVLGLWAAGVGDLNGDGFDDFILSQNGSGNLEGFFPASVGALRVIYGTPAGPRGSTGITFRKPTLQWMSEEWRRLTRVKQSAVAVSGLALVALMGVAGRRIWKKRTIVLVEKRERQSRLEERERIARDLHDELGSHLSRIHLSAEIVRSDPLDPGLVYRHTEEITREAEELRLAMGHLVNSLKLGDDSLEGFVSAISHHAESFFAQSPVKLHQRFPIDLDGFRISPEVKAELFPAVREALNNVLRHAKATELWIRVVMDAEALQVLVEDNGVGFDPSRQRGNGLTNFRERMSRIGADVNVVSEAGEGTSVRFKIPRLLLEFPQKTRRAEIAS